MLMSHWHSEASSLRQLEEKHGDSWKHGPGKNPQDLYKPLNLPLHMYLNWASSSAHSTPESYTVYTNVQVCMGSVSVVQSALTCASQHAVLICLPWGGCPCLLLHKKYKNQWFKSFLCQPSSNCSAYSFGLFCRLVFRPVFQSFKAVISLHVSIPVSTLEKYNNILVLLSGTYLQLFPTIFKNSDIFLHSMNEVHAFSMIPWIAKL